jgi:hypothetical protein
VKRGDAPDAPDNAAAELALFVFLVAGTLSGFLIFTLWLGSCGIVLVIATRLARYGWLAHILDVVNLLLLLLNSSSPAEIDDFR